MSSRRLLACGAAAGPLFVAVYTLAGAVRPEYSSLRHLVSSLALGPHGWVQEANFVVAGTLLLAGATGLGRVLCADGDTRWGPRLVAAAALLLAGAALFAVEPVNGYPPGTPARPVTYTLHGAVHAGISGVGFSFLVVATMIFARHFWRRGERGWAAYLAASALVALVGFVFMLMGLDQRPGLVELTGLFERIAFVVGFAWLTAVSLKLAPRPRPRRGSSRGTASPSPRNRGMMPPMRRLLLVAAAALVLAAIDQFLFHGVRVTESYLRVPLG